MKKIYLILVNFLLAFSINAQVIKEFPVDETGNINFSEVIEVNNQSQNNLYLKSKTFFVDNFKSANNVIQMDDKENGIIIGKGNTDISIDAGLGVKTSLKLNFSLKIASKNNKFKYEIYNLTYSFQNGEYPAESVFLEKSYYKSNGKPKSMSEQYKDKTLIKIEDLKKSIISQMTNLNKVSKDW